MTEHEAELDRAHDLMMRALDHETTSREWSELQGLLAADRELAREWTRLRQAKRATGAVRLSAPPDEVWEGYMDSVYRRVERGIGWILISVGAIVLLSYGLWTGIGELIQDATLPWYIKGGILALLVGLAIIIVSVIREKLFTHHRDPYQEVER